MVTRFVLVMPPDGTEREVVAFKDDADYLAWQNVAALLGDWPTSSVRLRLRCDPDSVADLIVNETRSAPAWPVYSQMRECYLRPEQEQEPKVAPVPGGDGQSVPVVLKCRVMLSQAQRVQTTSPLAKLQMWAAVDVFNGEALLDRLTCPAIDFEIGDLEAGQRCELKAIPLFSGLAEWLEDFLDRIAEAYPEAGTPPELQPIHASGAPRPRLRRKPQASQLTRGRSGGSDHLVGDAPVIPDPLELHVHASAQSVVRNVSERFLDLQAIRPDGSPIQGDLVFEGDPDKAAEQSVELVSYDPALQVMGLPYLLAKCRAYCLGEQRCRMELHFGGVVRGSSRNNMLTNLRKDYPELAAQLSSEEMSLSSVSNNRRGLLPEDAKRQVRLKRLFEIVSGGEQYLSDMATRSVPATVTASLDGVNMILGTGGLVLEQLKPTTVASAEAEAKSRQRGPTENTRLRAALYKSIKDKHRNWGYEAVAEKAREMDPHGKHSGETVRNAYRAMREVGELGDWTWERADRTR